MECGTFSRARDIYRDDLPGGGAPKLRSEDHPLGLPHVLSRTGELRDRVLKANELSDWVMHTNAAAHARGAAFLDENPQRSYRWLTPASKAVLATEGVFRTDYAACAYASHRRKAQTFVHNMKKCRQLACVCRHAHDRSEWKPTMKNGSQVYYPTREEAEYSAALSWSIGLSVMQHLLEKGRVKLAIPVVPMLFNETGDRTKWCKYPPHLTRDAAMVPMAVRLGFHPTGVHARLQSTEDPDYMNGRYRTSCT